MSVDNEIDDSNSGDLFVFVVLIGIYLFNRYKQDNTKKAWGSVLASYVAAVIINSPNSITDFFLITLSFFFLFFIFILMDKYGYLGYIEGGGRFRIRSGGGFGGGGFGGKW